MFTTYVPHWDRMGISASGLCVAHCLMLPVSVIFLPGLGLGFLAQEITHQILALLLMGAGICAFIPGYRRHGRLWVLAVALLSWVILAFAAFAAGEMVGELWETLFTLSASAMLIGAHLKNLSLCRLCALCEAQKACVRS